MANISGGGGGKDGFQHMMQHLGPAIQDWLKHMRAHQYDFSEESLAVLNESVQEMVGHTNLQEVEKERDAIMVKLLKAKSGAPALV